MLLYNIVAPCAFDMRGYSLDILTTDFEIAQEIVFIIGRLIGQCDLYVFDYDEEEDPISSKLDVRLVRDKE